MIALLKKIERSRNPNAIQIRPGRKSKKGGTLPAMPEKKQRRAASNKRRRPKSDPELHKVRRPLSPPNGLLFLCGCEHVRVHSSRELILADAHLGPAAS